MAYARKRDRAANDRERYLKKRAWMRAIKDVPCADCGHRYPAPCMDFDHVRGRKKFAVGQCLSLKLSTLKKEIAKCDVVCANCHRLRTHRRRKNGS
jgi:hypothetical protein